MSWFEQNDVKNYDARFSKIEELWKQQQDTTKELNQNIKQLDKTSLEQKEQIELVEKSSSEQKELIKLLEKSCKDQKNEIKSLREDLDAQEKHFEKQLDNERTQFCKLEDSVAIALSSLSHELENVLKESGKEMKDLDQLWEHNLDIHNQGLMMTARGVSGLEDKLLSTAQNQFNLIKDILQFLQSVCVRVDSHEVTITSLNNSRPTLVIKIMDMFQRQIDELARGMENVQIQFQDKISSFKNEAMKSKESFEKHFPALMHGSEDKRKNAPGMKMRSGAKKIKVGNNVTTFQIKTKKIKSIMHKYKNKDGTIDEAGRVLEVVNPSWFNSKPKLPEKTILIVGVTGAGKSTLINAIANFVLNVRFEDDHRFELVSLLEGEIKKQHNQALSQTDSITVYKIPFIKGANVQFNLNIIDTPGVGDTRGLIKDKELIRKMETLFSKDCGLVPTLDAVCFVSNAGSARLTPAQKYIFDKIITSFGIDMVNNILGLFTFDDRNPAKAVDAFEEAEIHLAAHFKFNSQGILTDKQQQDQLEKGVLAGPDSATCTQYQDFYANCDKLMATLAAMTPVSTTKTCQVMKSRQEIETNLYHLRYEMDILLGKKETLNTEKKILSGYLADETAHKDYKVEVTESYSEEEYLPPGRHVTNCLNCNYTCHDDCGIPNNDEKAGCIAMRPQGDKEKAACTKCKDHCHWKKHTNQQWKWVIKRKTEVKTAAEIKAKYEEAIRQQGSQKTVIETVEDEVNKTSQDIQTAVNQIRDCIQKLDLIALKTAATDSAAYLQQMIDTEDMNKEQGFRERIKVLREELKIAETMDAVHLGGNISGLNVQGVKKREKNVQYRHYSNDGNGYDGYDRNESEIDEYARSQEEDTIETFDIDEDKIRRDTEDVIRCSADTPDIIISESNMQNVNNQAQQLNKSLQDIQNSSFQVEAVLAHMSQIQKKHTRERLSNIGSIFQNGEKSKVFVNSVCQDDVPSHSVQQKEKQGSKNSSTSVQDYKKSFLNGPGSNVDTVNHTEEQGSKNTSTSVQDYKKSFLKCPGSNVDTVNYTEEQGSKHTYTSVQNVKKSLILMNVSGANETNQCSIDEKKDKISTASNTQEEMVSLPCSLNITKEQQGNLTPESCIGHSKAKNVNDAEYQAGSAKDVKTTNEDFSLERKVRELMGMGRELEFIYSSCLQFILRKNITEASENDINNAISFSKLSEEDKKEVLISMSRFADHHLICKSRRVVDFMTYITTKMKKRQTNLANGKDGVNSKVFLAKKEPNSQETTNEWNTNPLNKSSNLGMNYSTGPSQHGEHQVEDENKAAVDNNVFSVEAYTRSCIGDEDPNLLFAKCVKHLTESGISAASNEDIDRAFGFQSFTQPDQEELVIVISKLADRLRGNQCDSLLEIMADILEDIGKDNHRIQKKLFLNWTETLDREFREQIRLLVSKQDWSINSVMQLLLENS